MNKTASIVAATDFSAHARHAADRAARIAHENAAALTLLHVVPEPLLAQVRAWLGPGAELPAGLVDDARQRLHELAQRLQASRHVPVDGVAREGAVLATTMDEAERRDARLIVLGARGAGFVRRLVLGTTAERLVRSSPRPVLVVRQTPHERYRRVLVAVDFSPWSRGTLDIARWVAPHAHLVLATVFEVPLESRLRLAGVAETVVAQYRERARAEAVHKLHALAAAAGLAPDRWQPCVVEGDASFRLTELEQEHDCDLVAVGKHGGAMVMDLLLGSVTQHLLAESSADVLVSTRRDT